MSQPQARATLLWDHSSPGNRVRTMHAILPLFSPHLSPRLPLPPTKRYWWKISFYVYLSRATAPSPKPASTWDFLVSAIWIIPVSHPPQPWSWELGCSNRFLWKELLWWVEDVVGSRGDKANRSRWDEGDVRQQGWRMVGSRDRPWITTSFPYPPGHGCSGSSLLSQCDKLVLLCYAT